MIVHLVKSITETMAVYAAVAALSFMYFQILTDAHLITSGWRLTVALVFNEAMAVLAFLLWLAASFHFGREITMTFVPQHQRALTWTATFILACVAGYWSFICFIVLLAEDIGFTN